MSRRQFKKADPTPFTVTIESLSHDGRGIAHLDGKTTFIQNGLPGETVKATCIRTHGKFDEAIATEIINASPDRKTPPCKHYDKCGGCSMQHLSTDAQIKHKERMLLDQLKHFGNIKPETVLPPLTGPTLGYRRKARLGVRYVLKKEKLLVGFREKNGRYIAEINSCPVLDPRVGEKIEPLQQLIASLSIFQEIPQIEVAVGEKRTALIFRHLKPLNEVDHNKLIEFAKQSHFDIFLQPKGLDSIHKLWPEDNVDRLIYSLPDQQVSLQFHPSDFTQVNQSINPQMVNRAIELLDINQTDRLLDLFCGLGNFTIPLAKLCHSIVGVEGSVGAIERANENKKRNKIQNAEFHLANLAETVDHLPWTKESYSKILIDPPRSGAETMIPMILKMNPERILYISCNPATLARDAGLLTENKQYKLEKAGVMDMFPHTAHVESIALFVRRK